LRISFAEKVYITVIEIGLRNRFLSVELFCPVTVRKSQQPVEDMVQDCQHEGHGRRVEIQKDRNADLLFRHEHLYGAVAFDLARMAQYVHITVAACLPAEAVSVEREEVISFDKISKVYLLFDHFLKDIC